MSDGATNDDWLRLDNAAKIYPASRNDAAPAVFRVSVTLCEPVRVQKLQEALDALMERVPYYRVHLRRGFFWYYLQRHEEPLRVERLPAYPLSRIVLHRRGEPLLHVYAHGGTVAADFSHVLTDGYGAMRFLGSLAVDYLRRLGEPVDPGSLLMRPDEQVPDAEFEDAFQKHYREGLPGTPELEPAYHLAGVPSIAGYRTVTGHMPVHSALRAARRHGATLTEYLVAVYMNAIKRAFDEQANGLIRPRHKVIRIEVPVNMRRIHPSQTMRNFSLFVSPEIDLRLGDWPFERIVRRVHHQMNIQLDPAELLRQIARNVGGERSSFVRVVPRVAKDVYLSHLRRTIGDRSYSGVVSNLGRFILPDGLEPYVESAGVVLGPNAAYKTGCAVVSYADDLSITIGSVIADRTVEREFFRRIVADGVEICISERKP